jgi:hypothetical protein
MVKADPKRNYYADLEIPNNASTDEIKKAFRKLGRYPMEEALSVILTDPQQEIIILIGILEKKLNMYPSFKQYKLHMKSSATNNSEPNMTLIGGG